MIPAKRCTGQDDSQFDSPYADARSRRALLGRSWNRTPHVDLVILMLGTNDHRKSAGAVRPAFRFGVVDADRHREPQRCWAWRRCAALPGRLRPPIVQAKGFAGVFYEGRDAESANWRCGSGDLPADVDAVLRRR